MKGCLPVRSEEPPHDGQEWGPDASPLEGKPHLNLYLKGCQDYCKGLVNILLTISVRFIKS